MTHTCPMCDGRGFLTPSRVCANEQCRAEFRYQTGRATGGTRHATGVLYCSPHCARAVAKRRARLRDALVLDVPTTHKYPDAFYRDVAKAWRLCVSLRVRPGPALAEANDVPVSTVQRWIKGARQRGALCASLKTKVAA